jgi:DNA-binding response OmpR family regulator
MAIDVYYKGRPYIPEPELHIPKGFMIVSSDNKSKETLDLDEEAKSGSRILLLESDLERSRALMTLLRREGFPNVKWVASVKEAARAYEEEPVDRLVANGRTFKSQGNLMKQLGQYVTPSIMSFYNIRNLLLAQEHPYAQMSASLTSLVAFIVRRALHDHEEQLAEVIATARYCKLLAMRMGLPAVSVDGAVLAAWLSVPGIGRIIYDHMASPYPLDELFEAGEASMASARLEIHVLWIVKKYQALKKDMPEIVGDLDKVRKNIALPSERPEDRALLEAFLNVIKDDEFLKDVGRSQRRILLVDPEYSAESALALRLSNDGYEVMGVTDAKSALQIIFNSGTDVVISEVNLPDTDGLRFCRALRENAASVRLPFFFLAREDADRLATQCLEAGADDFFKKPADLEMMSIKIRNIIALKSSRGTKSGISGTLKDMSFTDIIQSLTTGDKDVEIQLQSGSQKGVLYIQQGEVIFAQAQGAEGQDAFYRMMTWQDGEFEITACHAVPPRNIYESAMSLLMEGARIVDDEQNLPDEEA